MYKDNVYLSKIRKRQYLFIIMYYFVKDTKYFVDRDQKQNQVNKYI